jgi:hypothetical protein
MVCGERFISSAISFELLPSLTKLATCNSVGVRFKNLDDSFVANGETISFTFNSIMLIRVAC